MIRFTQDACSNLCLSSKREWLETNGLGGFASSTITGLNTRRYHGLLVAATQPPVGRIVLLSKLEETLVVYGQRFELSVNRYPGAVHPQGYSYLKEFRLDPFPVAIYQVSGVELEKRVFMVDGENTTVIEYELRSHGRADGHEDGPECILEIRPLIAFRDYHSTTHRNDALNPAFDSKPGLVILRPYAGVVPMYLAHNAGEVTPGGGWYFNFEYSLERERGLDFCEDLFNPLVARFRLSRGGQAAFIASTEPRDARQVAELRRSEVERRRRIRDSAPLDEPIVADLTAAADQFLVQRGAHKTVIAGYHWFCDWGRDTMIALPGLTLATGRARIAKEILLAFAEHVDQGMLPNRFPDSGEPAEYNTVDATLWFFEAVRSLAHYTGDYDFVRRNIYPVLVDIIGWHQRGTRYRIHVDEDGLLECGEPGVQLTWMDAKIGDWVVTPRYGKPVEVQALWYNALRIMEQLATHFGENAEARRYQTLAVTASESFNRLFWNDSNGSLYDVVNGPERDGSVRPNQIFAVSLTYSLLAKERASSVMRVVEEELLTPYGLRSLSQYDPRFRPEYKGDPRSRDSAYHQGTVWTWLLGPFITAYVKVHGRSPESRRQAAEWLRAFESQLREAALGQVGEIRDGASPHWPRGCAAQAWSVAELLRAAVEDVFAAGKRSAEATSVSVA